MVNKPTNGVHRVWGQFKYTIKNEVSALEEAVTPVPTVVFNHVVGLGLNPEIEANESNATKPPSERTQQV